MKMEQATYKIPLKSLDTIYLRDQESKVRYWFYGIILLLGLALFLPWTQNIKAKGDITTLFQEQRPQNINSPIPGKIAKWYVKEGDFVKAGDTIMQISEIKEDYLDPNLVGRTQEQVEAKKGAIKFYKGKAATSSSQMQALLAAKNFKLEQLKNKLVQLNNKLSGEQAELEAVTNEFNLAKDQYERQQKMFLEGLVSQTQLQQRNTSFQNALAKKITAENKIAQTKQELLIVEIDQNGVEQEYAEKISKAEGDRLQSLSNIASGQGEMAKLENQVTNYKIRNGMYFILAPQDGQIVQASKAGIGEILKDGERITVIVPTRVNYAVEMYVRPVDLPLVSIGQKVRFMFDGFPAIIFSGWPENSYGTFGGKVVAFEHTISANGMFRVLVAEDPTDRPWPQQLKLGTGAQGIALLKDVPVWYELWRNINGFPPDYYTLDDAAEKGSAKK
ncbi:HlyD family secretion protein [Dyadobacter psychrophilus]|uniref:Multidrug resistance efflux pump n=1 Tax=Dyadobacter psychrophilus TaxID=651661 RepID=A0A1T5DZF6_9BACT|nr:HlyD family efflux transporter periplasmic adaptor subunit [Dyadobacter psychrophilus]SKB76866.1 Multidrug resistance efflux pump [Dyadobacter psychrophilus]